MTDISRDFKLNAIGDAMLNGAFGIVAQTNVGDVELVFRMRLA